MEEEEKEIDERQVFIDDCNNYIISQSKREIREKLLKKCPFCGEIPTFGLQAFAQNKLFHIRCGCGISTRLYRTEQEAIDRWNRRARRVLY